MDFSSWGRSFRLVWFRVLLGVRACYVIATGCFSVAAGLALYMSITSLRTGSLIGCGELTGCHALLSSQWAKIYPGIPVALPAVAIYAWLACLAWTQRVQALAWFLTGLVSGAAIWFIALQVQEHAFCAYCSATHVLALIGIVCLLSGGKAPATALPKRALHRAMSGLGGMALAGALALFQLALPFQGNHSGEDRHAISLPGPEVLVRLPGAGTSTNTGKQQAVFLFDYCCPHCRTVQASLMGLDEELSSAGLRVAFLPSPLNTQCNSFLLASPGSEFEHACDYALTMLGLWRRDPQRYAQLLEFVLSPGQLIGIEELVTLAEGLPTSDDLRWAQRMLDEGTELYGKAVEGTGIRALPILLYRREPGDVRIIQGGIDTDRLRDFLLSGDARDPSPSR
jgi:hypothetical protein